MTRNMKKATAKLEIRRGGIDLSKFCDPDSPLIYRHSPWRAGGVVFATDGSILIEVPAAAAPLVRPPCKASRVPRAAELLMPWPERGWLPWPNSENFGSELINRKHFLLVRKLPGIEWNQRAQDGEMIFFRFDGGRGAIATADQSQAGDAAWGNKT